MDQNKEPGWGVFTQPLCHEQDATQGQFSYKIQLV